MHPRIRFPYTHTHTPTCEHSLLSIQSLTNHIFFLSFFACLTVQVTQSTEAIDHWETTAIDHRYLLFGDNKDVKNSNNFPFFFTSIHKARFRLDVDGSSGSWQWLRAQRTSCHWGSKCQGPRAGQPRGYPVLGWEESLCMTNVCLAMLAGSTWSRCSPGEKKKKTFREKLRDHECVFGAAGISSVSVRWTTTTNFNVWIFFLRPWGVDEACMHA